MTLHRCQAVALDLSRLNPNIRLLIAVKLMDVILTPLAQCRDTAFPLEEGSATVVNKLPFFSLICDHCDIFAASHNSGLRASQTSGLVLKAWASARDISRSDAFRRLVELGLKAKP